MGQAGFATSKGLSKTSAIVRRLTDQWRDRDRAALGIHRDIGKVSARGMFPFSGKHIFGKHLYASLE